MEHIEQLICAVLLEWRRNGYTDTIIVDEGKLYSIDLGKYFTLMAVTEDIRANIFDEDLTSGAWSMQVPILF